MRIARDVTDRKKSEVDLRQAKETAERASRAKSQFLSELSHELRTPFDHHRFRRRDEERMFGPLGVKLYLTYARDILHSGQQMLDVVGSHASRPGHGKRTAAQIVDISLTDKVLNTFAQPAAMPICRADKSRSPGAALAFSTSTRWRRCCAIWLATRNQYNRPGGAGRGRAGGGAAGRSNEIAIRVNDSGIGNELG